MSALISGEQIRFKQTSEIVCADRQVGDEIQIEFQTTKLATTKARQP